MEKEKQSKVGFFRCYLSEINVFGDKSAVDMLKEDTSIRSLEQSIIKAKFRLV